LQDLEVAPRQIAAIPNTVTRRGTLRRIVAVRFDMEGA
jgi:hypothetical protein